MTQDGVTSVALTKREVRREDDCGLIAPQRQRLHNARVGLAALAELLQREPIVMVLVHLVEDLVYAFLRSVLVLGLRRLALPT